MKRPEILIESTTLSNGLRVVVAPDATAPVVTVGVYYRVGFRQERPGRSGFAHLFEHMMFQGSANVPKLAHISLINSSGGVANGSTSHDLTHYYQAAPSNALERVLWLEADRMRALKVDNENLMNQRDVVKEEVRRNIIDEPYGSFPWQDIPMVAFRKWGNAHTFYGDFADLDAAELNDVQAFFNAFYVPNNAAVVLLGDVTPQEGFASVKRNFGDIPPGTSTLLSDTIEPEQTEERRGTVEEKFGTLPALAVGYLMPKRRTKEWYTMALLDQMLHRGRAGKIYRELVAQKQIALDAWGCVDDLFGSNDPVLMTTSVRHKREYSSEAVLAAFDTVICEVLENGVTSGELEQAKVKWRSDYYARLESGGQYMPRYGLMHLLACFTLFDGIPQLVNNIPQEFISVTEKDILSVARAYLRKERRAIVFRTPARADVTAA